MRLKLISEATIQQVQNRIPIWTKNFFGGNEQEAQDKIPMIIAADPTKGKYSQWLIKQYKDKTARFPEDTEKLSRNLQLFDQKKSKLDNKDISSYTPASLAKALDQQFGLTNTERRAARKGELKLPPGAELVLDNAEYKVVKITDPKASSLLCSGTEWCVANEDTAEEYLEDGPLYLFYENGKRKYLAHYESDQFMDVYDEELEPPLKFRLIKILEPVSRIIIAKNPGLSYQYARDIIKGRWPEAEPAIAKSSGWAYDYARDVIKGRWPEGEPAIAKHPGYAVAYAKDFKGRWPEAEPEIAKDPKSAYRYANEIIKGRWPEAEPTIAKDNSAYEYARDIIKGRWPEAEPTIAKNPGDAYEYARDAIKGRWPEGEPAIAKHPWASYSYARDIIKGRWPEAEPTIAKDPNSAYEYARDIIKGRWPEAEPEIAKDLGYAYGYARNVIKGRWPEGEPTIAKDLGYAYEYARNVIKGRWSKGEPTIAKDPGHAYGYARDVIKGRWDGPYAAEAEQTIMSSPLAPQYKKFLESLAQTQNS